MSDKIEMTTEQLEALKSELIDKAKNDAKVELESKLAAEKAEKEKIETLKSELKADFDKQLDEVKKNLNPFTEPKVEVNEKYYPLGTMAITAAKAKNAGVPFERQLLEDAKTNKHSEVAAKYYASVTKAYEPSKFNQFIDRAKALDVGTITGGAGFLDMNVNFDYAPLLRNTSIIRQMQGVRVQSLPNLQMKFNKGLTGGTSYWLDSAETITASNPTFSQAYASLQKQAALYGIPNEFLRADSQGMAQIVQQDIIDTIGVEEDKQLIQGIGTDGKPYGLTGLVDSGNSFTRATTPTAAKVGKDLIKMLTKLRSNNVNSTSLNWLFHPDKYFAIMQQVDSNQNDMWYARTLKENGTILGFPVFQSANCPTTKGYLVAGDALYIGQGNGLIVDTDSSVYFASDQTGIRAIAYVNMLARYDVGIAEITSLDWDTAIS